MFWTSSAKPSATGPLPRWLDRITGSTLNNYGFPCYDFGFFVALGFPFSVVWYLLWTRGLRGLLVIGIFLGLYLTPWLCAIGVWAVTTGLDR